MSLAFADVGWLWVLIPVLALWFGVHLWLHILPTKGNARTSAAVRFSTLATLKRLRPSWTLRLRQACSDDFSTTIVSLFAR